MGTARPNFFGFIQSAELGIEVLAGRRDPRVSENHDFSVSKTSQNHQGFERGY